MASKLIQILNFLSLKKEKFHVAYHPVNSLNQTEFRHME